MRIKQHQLGALFRSATKHDKALLFSTPIPIYSANSEIILDTHSLWSELGNEKAPSVSIAH